MSTGGGQESSHGPDDGSTSSLIAHEENEDLNDNENTVSSSQSVKVTRQLVWQYFKGWWRTFVIVMAPLIFCPVPLILKNTEASAFYVIAIIAVYWITEAIPLAATALLPIVLFPALGVLTAGETAVNYLNDTNMLFVGGLMVAVAIEKWNLHKRIALLVLLLVGSNQKWLLFGFMSVTAFLSMWISNTATAAMMLPIAHAVLQEMKQQSAPTETDVAGQSEDIRLVSARGISARYTKSYNGTTDSEEDNVQIEDPLVHKRDNDESEITRDRDESDCENGSVVVERADPPGFSFFAKGLMLGVAYSANIGGIATLTGTGPNLVFKGDIDKLFPEGPGIDFGLWFVFASPLMILCLLLSWLYLSLVFCQDCLSNCKRLLCKKMDSTSFTSTSGARSVIRNQYKRLGPWKFAEVLLLVCFVCLALLWLFREPQFITGWGAIFKSSETTGKSYFSDSSTVVFIVLLLFILPAKPCCLIKGRNCFCACPTDGTETLLDWNSVQHKLPWNIVLLLGSGFALAEGAEASGLSCWIGSKLLGIQHLPDLVKSLSVSVIVASVTEVISNVATTTLFLPILAQLSVTLSLHPFYLMLPATVSASFAFMLPVATPPNTIAFSYGYLKVYDMVLTGILMNIVCICMVNVAINTWGVPLFDLHTFPNWTTSGSTSTFSQCNYTSGAI